jgi:CheY-like chemotaxis protein
MMPIADGRELLEGMRALPEFQSVPVVMLSSTTKTVALATPSGTLEVSAFIRKPAQRKKLLGAIVRLIDSGEKS